MCLAKAVGLVAHRAALFFLFFEAVFFGVCVERVAWDFFYELEMVKTMKKLKT